MATLITTDGKVKEITPQCGSAFTLEELQKAVGGYIEIVHIDRDFDMVVNEEGKLKMLPVNETATRLYRKARYTDDVIVGNALLCNQTEIR